MQAPQADRLSLARARERRYVCVYACSCSLWLRISFGSLSSVRRVLRISCARGGKKWRKRKRSSVAVARLLHVFFFPGGQVVVRLVYARRGGVHVPDFLISRPLKWGCSRLERVSRFFKREKESISIYISCGEPDARASRRRVRRERERETV